MFQLLAIALHAFMVVTVCELKFCTL